MFSKVGKLESSKCQSISSEHLPENANVQANFAMLLSDQFGAHFVKPTNRLAKQIDGLSTIVSTRHCLQGSLLLRLSSCSVYSSLCLPLDLLTGSSTPWYSPRHCLDPSRRRLMSATFVHLTRLDRRCDHQPGGRHFESQNYF